jgi:sulfide:quinone oxidoreductase
MGGRLRDLEEGYTQRFAIVIPPGPGWPLPAYELALLIAGQVRGMGVAPQITLVTPEDAPLATNSMSSTGAEATSTASCPKNRPRRPPPRPS